MGDEGQSAKKNGEEAASGASWGAPLERFDIAWQALEARLCAAVLIAEVASLTLWITLRGLSTDYTPGGNAGGLRLPLAPVGGRPRRRDAPRDAQDAARSCTAARSPRPSRSGSSSSGASGCTRASCGRRTCSTGCRTHRSLMLIGGLRGLATRLTLWVALLGASLATSRGKHIHVDVLIRYVPVKLRIPTAVLGSLAARLGLRRRGLRVRRLHRHRGLPRQRDASPARASRPRPATRPPARSSGAIGTEMGSDFFLLGRQASLDLRTLPRVIVGTPYDKWMTAGEWNAWLDGADWKAHFDKNAVDALHMDPSAPDATRMPQVTVPGTGEDARGLLIRELNFVFPFGLAVIALKFILRILLIISGHVRVDPEARTLDDEALVHSARARRRRREGGDDVSAATETRSRRGREDRHRPRRGRGLAHRRHRRKRHRSGRSSCSRCSARRSSPSWAARPRSSGCSIRTPRTTTCASSRPRCSTSASRTRPILVTIPLFTFVGYVLAEAKTPDRLVAAARTVLGWMPGGLAIVVRHRERRLHGAHGRQRRHHHRHRRPALPGAPQAGVLRRVRARPRDDGRLGRPAPAASLPLARLRARRAHRLQRAVQGGARPGRPRHRAPQHLLRRASARARR